MQKDYYEVLELTNEDKNLSEVEFKNKLKSNFRRLSKIHHPDKGGSEEQFKIISEAYDVLSDKTKRADYDNSKNNPFGNFDMGFNPFEEFFNRNNFYNQRRKFVKDRIIEIEIGVIESFLGLEKQITFTKIHTCSSCKGEGGDKITCDYCQGHGFTSQNIGTGFFRQIVRTECKKCSGNGFIYTNACKICNGETIVPVTETLLIKLPQGVDENQYLKINGKGDTINGVSGDIIIKVKIIPENNFEKNGIDLIYNAFFNLDDLNKPDFIVPHPEGNISVKFPKEFDTSKPLRVKSKGFKSNRVGDLYLKLNVKYTRP